MKYIKLLLISLFAAALFSAPAFAAVSPDSVERNENGASSSAPSAAERALCEGSGGTLLGNGRCSTPEKRTLEGTIKSVINILLFVVGIVAVIMIIIGGLRYVLSGGDSSATNNAKNTIIYSVVGLIVAFMAYAIVNFVLDAL